MWNKIIRSGAALLCLVCSSGNSQSTPPRLALQLSVDCDHPDVVNFTVTNLTASDIKTPNQALPWAINSLSVRYDAYLVIDNKTRELGREHVIADYFAYSDVRQRSKINGSLNFNSIIRDFSALRSSGDIVVFWSFDGDRLIAPRSQWRVSDEGVILFPRRRFFNTPCGGVIYTHERKFTQAHVGRE